MNEYDQFRVLLSQKKRSNFEIFAESKCYFKTFHRRRLMRGNGLVSDKIFFEADTGPDREPMKFPL